MAQDEYARLETLDGTPALLEGVSASGDLRGPLLEMSVEQRFRNAGPTNIEVVYSFPLPWGAVLLGVEVVLGEQRLTGSVIEKRQAEARYEEALCEGKAAIMLEKNADLSYSLSLGNLAAGETCRVTLRYAQVLEFQQDGLRLLIPTVIAPRFGDAVRDGGLQPHQAPTLDPLAAYPFAIRLRLHGDLAQARVASPSHPIGVGLEQTSEGEVLSVSLARRGYLDRDFVLIVGLVQDSLAVLARDPVAPDRVVALASFRPGLGAEAPATGVKILVDCSGSMAGDSMDAAKRALQAVTLQFQAGDRFALSRFGSSVEHRSRGLWSVTDATRTAAQRWVAGLEADLGGTEMEAALVSTCALAHEGPCDLLLVTDGEIYGIDRAIDRGQGLRASGLRGGDRRQPGGGLTCAAWPKRHRGPATSSPRARRWSRRCGACSHACARHAGATWPWSGRKVPNRSGCRRWAAPSSPATASPPSPGWGVHRRARCNWLERPRRGPRPRSSPRHLPPPGRQPDRQRCPGAGRGGCAPSLPGA